MAGRSLYETGYFRSVRVTLDTLSGILRFHVQENPFIRRIRFMGNTVFSDSLLAQTLETHPGETLNTLNGRRDFRSIRQLYRQRGFSLAHVDSVWIEDNTLTIRIDEGRLSDIRFLGMRKTKPFVLQRELPFRSGDLFQVDLFQQGIENVYSTGYFESLRFNLRKQASANTLNLHLKEQGFTLFRAGMRYDLERRTQTFLEAVEDNLFGAGAQGTLTGALGTKDKSFKASVGADQLFKTLLTARLSYLLSSQDFYFFESFKRTGQYRLNIQQAVFSVGQQMRRFGTLSFELRNERIHVKPGFGLNTPDESFSLWNLVVCSEVDTRDRLPFPTSGKYHLFEYETSAQFLGSNRPYTRMQSSMESYYPFRQRLVLHPRIRWGTADLTTPFAKQFKFGGFESFLGLPEEAIVGRHFLILSGGARIRLPWPNWLESHLSVRYDLGGAWSRVANIQGRDFRQGFGAMLLVNTPLGPIQTGFGKTDGMKARFYFSAGYRF
jgi:outer membrane protein assembly factor BamA